MPGQPSFHELGSREVLRILRRNYLGRIAYALHDQVEIVPVHYVINGNWLYVRTSPGLKTEVLGRNRWLAFEVDEVDSMFSWRSALVHGTAYVLAADATPDLARRYRRAITKLRELLPATLSEGDPVPFRTTILGIHIESLSGREATES